MNQKDVWNEIAPGWTHLRARPSKEIIRFAKGKKGRILDIGCGNCRNLRPFSRRPRNKVPQSELNKLYGIDYSSVMIKEAKKFCEKHNLEVNLKVGDAKKLPFPDNFFDVILCLATIHCIEKGREKAIREIKRVLKPKGSALLAVWFLAKKGPTYIPWKKKNKTLMRYYYIFEKNEFKELIEKNGLKVERLFLRKHDKPHLITKKEAVRNIFAVCKKAGVVS